MHTKLQVTPKTVQYTNQTSHSNNNTIYIRVLSRFYHYR